MARTESRILVPLSVEDTFSFLNRSESHRRFIPRMTRLEQTSPGEFGQIGTTLSGTLKYFGIRISVRYEIIEVETDHRLAMKGQMGLVRFEDGYILEKNQRGTSLTFWLDLHPAGWTKIFSPIAGLIGKVHAWETLRNLKREAMRTEIAPSLSSSSQ